MNIQQTHTYDADQATLFNALTNAETLCTWWTTKAESDPRDGGKLRYEFLHAPEKTDMDLVQDSTYIQCSNGNISYEWNTPAGATTVHFEVTDGQIKLLHENVPEAGELPQMLDQGWNFFLQNLASVLSGGPDGRAQMGLITA